MGAYGGRRELMEQVAPAGQVYQAGTLSGNPLATVAGNAQLAWLEAHDPFVRLEELAGKVAHGIAAAVRAAGIPAVGTAVGSMFGVFFREGIPRSFEEAKTSDAKAFARFHRGCSSEGYSWLRRPSKRGSCPPCTGGGGVAHARGGS